MTNAAMQIFDRRLLRRRWQRIEAAHWQNYPVLEIGAELLTERLADVKRDFKAVLEFGARSNHLAQRVEPLVSCYVRFGYAQTDGLSVIGDAELLPMQPGKFDLVLSNMALHWINDLPGCLRQIHACLQPDGLFLAVMAGGRSLQELRTVLMQAEEQITGGISPRVSPMVDLQSASQLLQR
ncbi:MAG: methyltransferase domain-containing protein, partial [Burkholderiaceae bacterium]|nr:methyltransferase domain-containing protein [Burkholderiaceae bacterium]